MASDTSSTTGLALWTTAATSRRINLRSGTPRLTPRLPLHHSLIIPRWGMWMSYDTTFGQLLTPVLRKCLKCGEPWSRDKSHICAENPLPCTCEVAFYGHGEH